jgi:ankyrin repeat protein
LDKNRRSRKPDEDVLLAGSTLITTIKFGVHDGNISDTRIVQFSHYSIVEFLTSERLANSKNEDLSQYYISPESAHTTLAQSCIGTLLQLDNHFKGVTQDFPLAEYAAQNWFHHAQYKDVALRIQDGMNCLFDPDRKHLTAWLSVHDLDHVPSRSQLSKSSNPPEPSPLYYATLCGIRSVVEHLVIRCQQDPNKSHGDRGTPLHAAVALGHTEIVQCLLEHDADVNVQNKHNSTPLHEASGSGNLDVMQLLLSRGADVNVLDDRGDSPLHKASLYQRSNAVKLLVEGGAYVDAFNHWGDSPLHEAVRHRMIGAVDLLVRGGANVNIRDKFNSTPLHEASGNGDLDITRLLLSHGTDVNVFDDWGDSPLRKALRFRKSDVAELLIKGGADVDVRDKPNSTRLYETSGIGNPETAQLSHGIAQGWNHKTPLHSASFKGESGSLIGHEADVDAKNDEGHTPASAAHDKLLNNSVPGENMAGRSCVNLPLLIFNLGVVNHRVFSLYLDSDSGGGGDGGIGNSSETLPLSASERF